MAEVKDLLDLNREPLNRFAAQNGIADPEGFPNKEALATELSPRVTPEALAVFKAAEGSDDALQTSDPAVNPVATPPTVPTDEEQDDAQHPQDPATDENSSVNGDGNERGAADPAGSRPDTASPASDPANDDPAVSPESDGEDVSTADLEEGDYVYYPHSESEGGERRGRVTAVGDGEIEVVYIDGSHKWFGTSQVRKA